MSDQPARERLNLVIALASPRVAQRPPPRLLDPPPHLLRRDRHFEVGDAEAGERVERGAHDRGGRADRAGFAAALGAERIVGTGLAFVAFGDEQRQIVGARHRVVHERSGHELAAAVIGAALEQRLAEAERKAAVDLALDDHRVDDGADVVDPPEADDLGAAGLRIDLEPHTWAPLLKAKLGGS